MLMASPLVLTPVSIGRQHLSHHLSVLRVHVMENTQIMQY